LVVILACGASTLRRSQTDFTDLVGLRSEYVSRHPDSPYRENVSRGEIVRGMDVFGVIASWGLPESRVQDGADFERWLYVDAEDVSNEPVGYALQFEKGVLKTWNVQRVGLGLKTRESTAASGLPKQEPQKGKPVPTD
jgi:hypothetical protein